ncbi:O-antigen ligase family protein [Brevundimonas diminuta]|uniref:O-antigen ligase family protein n=1 Tax=Brevundimonas diminuta TaxID=293 RepID=UPI00320BB3B3
MTGASALRRPDPDAPTLWEQAAAGLILTLLSGALLGPIFAPQQEETPVLRLIWPPIYLVILGLAAFRARRMATAWPAFIPLLLMIAMALASSLWSQAPDVTERRVLALGLTGVFAVYLGAVFRGIALPRMLTATFLILGLCSLIAVFAFPGFGIHHDANPGMWRGVWYEKNQLGMLMSAGLIAATALWASPGATWDRQLALTAMAVCALALLGSQSKTALIMAMLGGGLVVLCGLIRRTGPVFGIIAVWCLGVALVGGLWVWSEFSVEILALFGKDPSLTGRTEIWDAITRMTERRPWLGYGYSAFWLQHTEPMEWIRHETGWRVPSAHQGWLDLRAELGWAGVCLVGAIVAVTSAAVLIRLSTLGRREGYWSLAWLAAFLLLSLSESVLMRHQDLPWTLFMALMARNLIPDRPD